jgi:hypothetical protein
MKKYIFYLLLIVSITGRLNSQDIEKPINIRFKGGEKDFVTFFSKNISLPKEVKDKIFGNSITRISVNPKGKIVEIVAVNPIDSIVDKEVLRVVNLSERLWLNSDKDTANQVFYIQILFSRSDLLPNAYRSKIPELEAIFPEPAIIEYNSATFIKNEELLEKANSALKSEKFEEALPLFNELIKRDPFNRDLYKVRIMINIKLNKPELVNQDDEKIFNFADGYSLDDLTQSQKN